MRDTGLGAANAAEIQLDEGRRVHGAVDFGYSALMGYRDARARELTLALRAAIGA